MGRYVGEIQICETNQNGYYVNFYPCYEIINQKFVYLHESDISAILPDSQYLNLNLCTTSSSFVLSEQFQNGDDLILDFSFEDLIPNLNGAGIRYHTAWKLDVSRNGNARMMHMEDLGYYLVLDASCALQDWRECGKVELESDDICDGMEIFLKDRQDPTLVVGPFRVYYDQDLDSFYARITSDLGRHLVPGFICPDGVARCSVTLEQQSYTRVYFNTKAEGMHSTWIDKITPEELLENFRITLSKRYMPLNKIDLTQTGYLISQYEKNLSAQAGFPKEMIDKRAQTLRDLFDVQKDQNRAIETVLNLAGPLLNSFSDQDLYRKLTNRLAEDEEFLENFEKCAALQHRMEKDRQKVESLHVQKERLEAQVKTLNDQQPEKRLKQYFNEITRLEQERQQAQAKLDKTLRKAGLQDTIDDLEMRASWLEAQVENKEHKRKEIEKQLEFLTSQMDEMLALSARKAMETSFDNLISERMMIQSTKLNQENQKEMCRRTALAVGAIPLSHMDQQEMVDYLVRSVHQYRPDYSRNEILNLFICLSHGMLSVFCGQPGSGKSSICRIIAAVLGLQQPQELLKNEDDLVFPGRFVQISVEKGWTSRRDWIGYYNSLTRSFDKANAKTYDLLSVLDQEARNEDCQTNRPSIIMLDNANLSAMEYYWADFMTMSEGGKICGEIALGESFDLLVPNSIRFVATVNTDHTSEPLSVRLLDRAWVIHLPSLHLHNVQPFNPFALPSRQVSLSSLEQAFQNREEDITQELISRLDRVIHLCTKVGLCVSTRSQMAMLEYIATAVRWFEPEGANSRSVLDVAIDYAIAQRVLPMINGSGPRYGSNLEKLKAGMSELKLKKCEQILEDILRRGEDSMQYYQFF